MAELSTALHASVNIAALAGLGLAIVLGLLVGVQRGWTLRHEASGARFAGVRTFTLLGLAGGLTGVVRGIDPGIAGVVAAAIALLVLVGYAKSARSPDRLSGTASLVALLIFGCGFLATSGQEQLATLVAVAMTIVLALRTQLHGWVAGLTETEVNAIVRFALIAIAILPLLPDRSFGPYDAWNPRQLWLVVVFVSGFSFLGYIAAKRFGAAKGVLAMAAAGAMVSSTAVTATLAARLRDPTENAPMLVAGVATASSVMLVRVLCLVAVLAPEALWTLTCLVAPAALVSTGAAAWALRAARRAPDPASPPFALRNPFRLLPALGLMALVMLLTLLARWMMEHAGGAGVAAVLAISGLADVDSAIIATGNLPAGTLDGPTAGLVLAAPVFANTLFKAGVAIAIAGPRVGWRAALPLVASVAVGLIALPFLLR